MKRPERDEARALYLNGATYNEIVAKLSASKSTVSLWCADLATAKRAALRKATEAKLLKKRELQTAREASRQYVRVPAEAPYEEYYLYTYEFADGVTRLQLVHRETKHHLVLSRARYRMSVHLGRRLARNEQVLHRDDLKDDDISNLVLAPQKGPRLVRGKAEKECVMCEAMFIPKRKTVETCSKACRYLLTGYSLMKQNQ
jgi:hypothetical protein